MDLDLVESSVGLVEFIHVAGVTVHMAIQVGDTAVPEEESQYLVDSLIVED